MKSQMKGQQQQFILGRTTIQPLKTDLDEPIQQEDYLSSLNAIGGERPIVTMVSTAAQFSQEKIQLLEPTKQISKIIIEATSQVVEASYDNSDVGLLSNTGVRFADFLEQQRGEIYTQVVPGFKTNQFYQKLPYLQNARPSKITSNVNSVIKQQKNQNINQTMVNNSDLHFAKEDSIYKSGPENSSSEGEIVMAKEVQDPQWSLNQSQNKNLINKWNLKGEVAALEEVNMEKTGSMDLLINDYINHEYMAKTNQEAAKLSSILHGHKDLTETFLGPSSKVRSLKNRVKQAQIQQKASIELQKKFQIMGRKGSNENVEYDSQRERGSSNEEGQGNSHQKQTILVDKNPTAWLTGQAKRFKPTNDQMWESGKIYSEEMKQKASERMVVLANMKKTCFKSPFQQQIQRQFSSTNNSAVQVNSNLEQQAAKMMNKTQLTSKKNSSSPVQSQASHATNLKQATTSKAFYLYDLQLQKKRSRLQQLQDQTIIRHSDEYLNQFPESPPSVNNASSNNVVVLMTQKKVSKAVGNTPELQMSVIKSHTTISDKQNSDEQSSGQEYEGECLLPDTNFRQTVEQTRSDCDSDQGATPNMCSKNIASTARQQSDDTAGEPVQQQLFQDNLNKQADKINLRVKLTKYKESDSGGNYLKFESSGKNNNRTDRNRAEDQVSKESPYFMEYDSSSKQKIQVGGLLTQNASNSLKDNESSHEKSELYQNQKMSGMHLKKALFNEPISRASSLIRQEQLMEEILEMQKYGDLAMTKNVSRQTPDPVKDQKTQKVNSIIQNRNSTLRAAQSGSGEYQMLVSQPPQSRENIFLVEGTAMVTKTSHMKQNTSQQSQQLNDLNHVLDESEKIVVNKFKEFSIGDEKYENLARGSAGGHSTVLNSKEDNRFSFTEHNKEEVDNNNNVFVLNYQNSEMTEESKLMMGGTSSKFNTGPLLPNIKSPEVRPLSVGVDGCMSSDIVTQVKTCTEKSMFIADTSCYGEDITKIHVDHIVVEKSTEQVNEVIKSDMSKPENLDSINPSLELKEKETLLLVDDESINSNSQSQLTGDQMKEPPLMIQQLDNKNETSATIDYNKVLSRAKVIEVKLDKQDDSSLLTKFKSNSRHSPDISYNKFSKQQEDRINLSEQKTDTNERKKKDSIIEYSNLYGFNHSTLKKSMGENSLHTEFLSKFTKHGPLINKNNNQNLKTLENNSSKNDDQNSQKEGFTEVDEAENQDTYRTLIKNQSQVDQKTMQQSSLTFKRKSVQKVSAYKLPLAKGKGDLLPALEKDLREPGLSFKNLSRLFKDKQKEKFYSKNAQIARNILKKVGGEKFNSTSNCIVNQPNFPIVENHQFGNLIEQNNEATSDYFDTGFSSKKVAERHSSLDLSYNRVSKEQYNQTVRERKQNMSELDHRRQYAGHPAGQLNMSSFRANGKLSLEPNLEAVREQTVTVLTKQQKKLNDLINLKYDIQRKREMSSMVHLSKPFDSFNDSSIDLTDYNQTSIQQMSIMGQSHSQAMAYNTGTQKFFQQPFSKIQQDQQQTPQKFGSDSIEIGNGNSLGSSSRFANDSHHIEYHQSRKHHQNMNKLIMTKQIDNGQQNHYVSTRHRQLQSLPISNRQSASELPNQQFNSTNMTIRIANIKSQRRSRLSNNITNNNSGNLMPNNHSAESQKQVTRGPNVQQHPRISMPNNAFNKTATAKLSLEVLRGVKNKQNTQSQNYPAQNYTLPMPQDQYTNREGSQELNFEGGSVTVNRQESDRSEYEPHSGAIPAIKANNTNFANKWLNNKTSNQNSYQQRQQSIRSLHKPLHAHQTRTHLNPSQSDLEIVNNQNNEASNVVIKTGHRLINSHRSNSLAHIAPMNRKTSQGFHQVPMSRMPILIVDSAYRAQKHIKSYIQRKLINSTTPSKFPTVLI